MNDKGYDNTFLEMDFLFLRKDQGNVTIRDENYFLGEKWELDDGRDEELGRWKKFWKVWNWTSFR